MSSESSGLIESARASNYEKTIRFSREQGALMKIRRLLSVLCLLSGAFAQQGPFGRPDTPVSKADREFEVV